MFTLIFIYTSDVSLAWRHLQNSTKYLFRCNISKFIRGAIYQIRPTSTENYQTWHDWTEILQPLPPINLKPTTGPQNTAELVVYYHHKNRCLLVSAWKWYSNYSNSYCSQWWNINQINPNEKYVKLNHPWTQKTNQTHNQQFICTLQNLWPQPVFFRGFQNKSPPTVTKPTWASPLLQQQ